MKMNMKLSEKTPVKRVFVSIREQPSLHVPKKPIQPKPPSHPARFIRKKRDSSRSSTPDQVVVVKPNPPTMIMKPTFRRSLSPFFQPVTKENIRTSYVQPKECESLLSIPSIDKEDSLCMPYELTDMEKPVRTRAKRTNIKNLCKNIDLTKGSFSKKQIISESNLSPSRIKDKENSRLSVSSILLACDQSTTIPSRTPSPILPSRNTKCHILSKNFKINKQNLVNDFEKKIRSVSAEKETSEAPWQSILRDLDNVMQIKDLSPNQPVNDMPRMPVKLTRV